MTSRPAPARAPKTGLSFAPLASVVLFLLAWHALSLRYPAFILPGPLAVAQTGAEKLADGSLLTHAATTLIEALGGLLAGGGLGALCGYLIARSALAERLLSPFIVASQGIPVVAIAPLLFIWFGSGLFSKILVCALVVFFPITINVAAGVRGIPQAWRDLFAALRATRAETLLKLEIPGALPMILAGARIGATLSVIGAVVGEFLSSTSGLGFLVKQGTGLYDTPLVMLGVVCIMLVALGLYGSVRLVERVTRMV